MEYNEPVKKEDEKKNWLSYISEKSEEVYKIFKTATILLSICYIILKQFSKCHTLLFIIQNRINQDLKVL